jgi:hypothetical protein
LRKFPEIFITSTKGKELQERSEFTLTLIYSYVWGIYIPLSKE